MRRTDQPGAIAGRPLDPLVPRLQRASGRQEIDFRSFLRPLAQLKLRFLAGRKTQQPIELLSHAHKLDRIGDYGAIRGVGQFDISRVPKRPQQIPIPGPVSKIH